ncbi:MAG: hypothetical protein ACYS8I_01020 [Planctomycetota bacterium]|jgi:hypothetical protein
MKSHDNPARPSEQEVPDATIGDGRSSGSGTDVGAIPRGIEVLVKKASVDPQFKKILLEKCADAAGQIGIELTDAEAAMLARIPREQLEAIISGTKVKPENRHVFLSNAGKLMLAALGVAVIVTVAVPTLGHQIDLPPETKRPHSEQLVDPNQETEKPVLPNQPHKGYGD